MSRERKIPENDAQPRIVFCQQLMNKSGELSAGRTLEIAEFFQCNWCLGVASNVRRIQISFHRGALCCRNVFNL